MKREYKIACYRKDNEWSIFREFDWMRQWLTTNTTWSNEKKLARRFLYKQDVESALSIVKTKWDLKTEEQYIEERIEEQKEKKSWSDFSS